MRLSAFRKLMIASLLVGMAGCQSGPRWAWWKPPAAPDETAQAAAETSKPALPSAGATPQAVAAAGLEPVPSPSATNLAATSSAPTAPAVPPLSIPNSSTATIANAPLASYPATAAAATSATPSPTPAATNSTNTLAATSSPSAAATTSMSNMASVPATGPYDPNAYQANTSMAAASNADQASAMGDRYGTTATTATTSAPDRYAMSTPVSSPRATATPDQYVPLSTTTASAATAPNSAATSVDPYGPVPQAYPAISSTSITSITPTTAPSPAVVPVTEPTRGVATVALTSPAGQYRPGGTSTYLGGTPEAGVQVATRPAVPAATQSTAPTATPAGTTVPGSQPASAIPANGAGTRTY